MSLLLHAGYVQSVVGGVAFAIGAAIVALQCWADVVITLISGGCNCALCVGCQRLYWWCYDWPSALCSDFRLLILPFHMLCPDLFGCGEFCCGEVGRGSLHLLLSGQLGGI